MNVDEAKVPKDVDGDWRSIEIFLFSNGQQYSPPRKYYLGVDDLNLWDTTLNQLGQSHFGPESPVIDLYTTDGQLVEGPLELRDGQAYVAVVPPDTFIDTGYQKYLLKATRSWEKRQARRKVPECVLGEPCCLCPEKEWCCDLQMCCLCAEKEDAEFATLLKRTSGQMAVKSADGRPMSSVSTKPDAYEPLNKIDRATAGEREVSLDKYEYSSVLVQARPDDYEVKPVEPAARSVKYDARSSENPLTPDENVPTLSKNGATPGEYEPNSGKNVSLASEDEARESGSERGTLDKHANEIEKEKRLNDNNDKPNKDTGDTDSKRHHTAKFKKHGSVLSLIGESELEKKGENAVKDSVNSDEPSGKQNDTGIAVDAPKLDRLERKNDNTCRLTDTENEVRIAEPTRDQRKSEEIIPAGKIVGENQAKQGEHRKKPDDHVGRLNTHVSKGDDHEAGLENAGSERNAKVAASGSKATPRDRLSRARNSIQHKLEIPTTIIDEPPAKLDESDIKDRVTARKNSLPPARLSTEKKRLSIAQTSSLLKKPPPTPTLPVPRKSEDRKSMKPTKEILPKKTPGSSSTTTPSSASNDKSKPPRLLLKRITPTALPQPTISNTNLLANQESLVMDKGPLENVTDVKQATDVSTYSFNNLESELKSSMFTSAKPVDNISNFPEETQTELNFDTTKPLTDIKEVQTEAAEQQPKDVSLFDEQNYRITAADPDENMISIVNNGDTINIKLNIAIKNIMKSAHSSQKNTPQSRSLTDITKSEKESQISIGGDKVVQNNKLNSGGNDHPFQGYGFEGSPRIMIVQCAGCGLLNNPALRDLPPRSDNDKNYLALLTNPVHEDNTNDSSNCYPVNLIQSQLCDQKQSQTRIPFCGTNPLSEVTLDTITTVRVSGGPSVKREVGNCTTTNTLCRTEEAHNDCAFTKRSMTITDDLGTKCSFQNQSVSSLSVTEYTDNMSNCVKTCKYKEIQVCSAFCPPVCPATYQKAQTVCSKTSAQMYPLVLLSKGCQPTCPQAQTQTQGCLPISPACLPCCPGPSPTPVHPQECTPPLLLTCPSCYRKPPSTLACPLACPKPLTTPTCPPCCPKPPTPTCPSGCPKPTCPPYCPKLPPTPVCPQGCTPPPLPTCPPCCPKLPARTACPQGCKPPSATCCSKVKPSAIQIQTLLCPHGRQFCDAQTQTRWASIAARLHCDGRYSFHLPPLDMLNSFPM